MKELIFSDLHMHNWKNFGTDKSTHMSNRLVQQIDILKQIRHLNDKYKIDNNIFGGDLVHLVEEIPTEVLNVVENELRSWNVPMDWCDGNHDMTDRISPEWFEIKTNAFKKLCKTADHGSLKIKLVHFNERVDYDKLSGYDILVLHKQPVLTNRYGHQFDGVDWRRLADNNKLVFFAHYHEKTVLANNCFVIGAPMHFEFW